MLLLLLTSTAISATGDYPVRLTVGLVGTAASGQGEAISPKPVSASRGGGVVGRGSIHLRGPLAIEGAAREGWLTHDARSLGGLATSLRWTGESGRFGRVGVAHHHEVPVDVLMESPVRAALGEAEGIRHRTGAEVGLGVDLFARNLPHPPWQWVEDRMGMSVELSANWFSRELGPPLYGFVEVLWWAELGRRR